MPTSHILLRTGGVLSVAALALGLAACSPNNQGPAGESGDTPEQVSLVLRNDTDTFDPFTSAGEAGAKQLFDAVYDTLVRVDANEDGVTVVPSMAASWDITPTSGTFTLVDGLSCTDGTAIDASGIAKNLEHLANPETASRYASRIFGPEGPKSIVADDAAGTVSIELNAPNSYMLEALSQAYIVCPTALDSVDGLTSKPAETGPYALKESKRGERYTLEARETPTVALSDIPKSIEMKVVADDTTRANLISTKQADIVPVLGRDFERLEKAGISSVDGYAYLADALLFNQAEGRPGADPKVRRALALAVDAAGYTKAATFDLATPVDTIYTPNVACYTESNGALTPKFDLDEAKKALAEAGFTEAAPLKVRVLGWADQNSGPEFVAESLREAGVDVEVSKGTFEQAIGEMFGDGNWDVTVFPYPAPIPVPNTVVNQITGEIPASLNTGHVNNAEYAALTAEAAGAMGDEQCKLWGEAEAALLDSVDIKPVQWSKTAWFNGGYTFEANSYNVDLRTIRVA